MSENLWVSVADAMPDAGVKVIAYFKNEHGKHRRIMAFYAPKHTLEEGADDEDSDYSDEHDAYFLKPGWYERNEFEEVHWMVDGDVTHWMPLPRPPMEAKV